VCAASALRIALILVLLAALRATPGHAAATLPPAGAAFLGMAVGTGIIEDAQGLTDIQGIHYAIRTDRLPVTRDLQVYTRWTGSGAHTVAVDIRQASTGTSLRGTTDNLDFGSDRVTWFEHDFTDTTFPAAGTYLVQVTLDGRSVATYALYVNAADQLTERPAFVLSVPAERGWVDGSGNANVAGIFEYFSFAEFPATESFRVVTVWFSGDGGYDHSVRISDASGATVAQSQHALMSARGGRMTVSEDVFHSIAFPSAGLYTATVFLNGYAVTSFPLVIRGR
jgi:hypothetical protein